MIKSVVQITIVLVVSVIVALSTMFYTQRGPDYTLMCNLGKSADGMEVVCPELSLSGGFPAPFMYDRAGVSVVGNVSFLEDDFRVYPFISNIAFYFIILGAICKFLIFLRKRIQA